MALLVRKIQHGRWPKSNCELGEICGDVFGDIRTTNNTLSFWRIEDMDDLDEAILAIITGSGFKPETVVVAWIDEELVLANDISIESTPGDAAARDLSDTHRDLCNLTYSSLGTISKLLLESIHSNRYERRIRSKVISQLRNAKSENKLELDRCSDEVIKVLGE